MPFNLEGTQQFVKLMVKPRPSMHKFYSKRVSPTRHRLYSHYAFARKTYKRILVKKTTTTLTTPDDFMTTRHAAGPRQRVSIEEQMNACGTETSTSNSDGTYSIDVNDLCWDSDQSPPVTPPRPLRSYRQRKAKSINEAELFTRVKEDVVIPRHFYTWPDAVTRSIESTLFASGSSQDPFHTSSGLGLRRMQPRVDFGALGHGTFDFGGCIEACSTYRRPLVPGPGEVLQAVDRRTGVVFQRIRQGGQPDMEDVCISGSGYSSNLSFRLAPARISTTVLSGCAESMNMLPPSMILTMPTPVEPQSPVFVSQSPITVSKFFEALDSPLDGPPEAQTRSLVSTAPRLASCGDCGLFEFEQGLQCRDCDQQWLACKVWYRAQDGGRRRWLTAPYIRPGESNARNRALMHDVGVPGCFTAADAEHATCSGPVPARPWRTLRRVRRFLRARAVRARGWLHAISSAAPAKGKDRLCSGRTAALRPRRRTLALTASVATARARARCTRLWTTFAKLWRAHGAQASPDTPDAPRAPPSTPAAVLCHRAGASPRCGSGRAAGACATQGGGSSGLRWLGLTL